MGNATYAKEWLIFGKKNLITARRLFELDHFTDIVGAELQQGLEKSLKSLLAYHNSPIPKTHDLSQIAYLSKDHLSFCETDFDMFDIITTYYKFDRYPNPNYFLPSKEEIENSLIFAEYIFEKICKQLCIEIEEKL